MGLVVRPGRAGDGFVARGPGVGGGRCGALSGEERGTDPKRDRDTSDVPRRSHATSWAMMSDCCCQQRLSFQQISVSRIRQVGADFGQRVLVAELDIDSQLRGLRGVSHQMQWNAFGLKGFGVFL